MSDLETCLAMLFKRKGKNVLSEKEFVFAASMDYRWFTPKEAQSLLDIGIKKRLLERTDGFVKPSFAYKDLGAPVNFKPSKDILKEPAEPETTFARIINAISRGTGQKKRDIVARINKVQERLGVDAEVAALAVARENGIDIAEFVDEVRKEVLAR
jgi:hypothetical protein